MAGSARQTGKAGTGTRSAKAPQGSYTALQVEQAENEAAAKRQALELAESEAREADAELEKHSVINMTGRVKEIAEPEVDTAEEDESGTRVVRVKYDLPEMTFGREIVEPAELDEYGHVTRQSVLGKVQNFNFKEGRQYEVPVPMAKHMEQRGLLLH